MLPIEYAGVAFLWTFVGGSAAVMALPKNSTLLQTIVLVLMCGPIVWVIWSIVLFFQWLSKEHYK
jgi:hypothetical protein